jgi:hypothetical protein
MLIKTWRPLNDKPVLPKKRRVSRTLCGHKKVSLTTVMFAKPVFYRNAAQRSSIQGFQNVYAMFLSRKEAFYLLKSGARKGRKGE